MVKHRLRESIKSLFGSHIDPEKEKQLRGAKIDIEDKVKRILKLIKDDNLEEDAAPVELSKKDTLVKLIDDFHNQYRSLYTRYDHLTVELRKKIIGKRGQECSSSSSDSDSDYSSRDKDSKYGQNEFQKMIDGIKQELEMAHMEVAELNQKLTITCEEKEDLNSKYLAALSKIQAADEINMDLKTDAEALGIQRSKLLVENSGLNKQLDIAGKMEAELNRRLEDLKREKDNLTLEKETAFQQIDEEQKITDSLRTMTDQLKDEKLALRKELEAVTGELSILKQQLEHAEQKTANISHNLKVTMEENESLMLRVSQVSNEVQLANNRIEDLVAESSQLKEKLDKRERKVSTLTKMHEGYVNESSNQIRALETQVTNLELVLESLQTQNRDMEEQIKSSTTEASELGEHNLWLQNQINNFQHDLLSLQNEKQEVAQQCERLKLEVDSIHSQKSEVEEQINAKNHEKSELREENLGLQGKITVLEKTLAGKEVEFCALQDKLHEEENEASAQIIAFTAQINNLQKDLLSLQKEKEELVLHSERAKEEHSESLIMVENEKNELASKTMDHQRTLEEQKDAYQKLDEEYKQIDNWFKECKVKLEDAENKIEEMTEEFKKGIESKDQMVADLEQTAEDLKRDLEVKGDEIDTLLENVRMLEVKLRLSNQKLRVTEQLLSEREESFRKAEEKFQQDQRSLEDRIATLSAIIAANSEAYQEIIITIKESVNSVMTGIETVFWKFSGDYKNYEKCISNISHELQIAKNCVREMNKEKERLKDRRHLVEQLQDKKEHELALREMVEKLEAKASGEELGKKNLTTTVVQLQKTVGELEKVMKEKDDGILNLGEEKREAIRQLCLWIDYHRRRYDDLKDILSKNRRGQRAT